MASRGSVSWLALALLVALLPSAASQAPQSPELPRLPIEPGADHTVVTVEVPLAGAAGSGSLQVPVDGGILDIRVDPILLPGPGGSVDVEAYLAQVRLLLPSGAVLPMPSMVVRSEDRAIEGPAAQALADLAASAEELKVELEALAAELSASNETEPEPEPEPEPAPDPMAEQLAALQAQAEALAAEAGWVQALADEAAGASGSGAAEQLAIAGAMLARVEAGLALVQKGLDAFEAEASALAEDAGVPDAPEMPSSSDAPDPDETGSSSGSASSSASASPPPEMPAAPDVAAQLEQAREAAAAAQAQADEAVALAQAARDELAVMAGAIGGELVAKADELVDEQAAIDGARAAAALAVQALADGQAGAQAMAADLQAELEAAADQQSQGPRGEADSAALAAQAAIAEAIGRLQWAQDWVAEAQAMAGAAGGESLADAAGSLDSAQRTAEAMAAIVERYASSQTPAEAGELAAQLDGALASLDDAVADAESARDELSAALDDVASSDPLGGLDPIPDEGSMPGAPGAPAVPVLPEMPGMPVSFDRDAMAVCVDSLVSQACFHYRSPLESPPGSLTVLVAVPAGPGALDDLDLPVDPPIDVPSPDDPLPTPPLPTGLPGLGSSSSSSSSAPAEEEEEEEQGEGPEELPDPLDTSTSASTSSGSVPRPHLKAEADRETLGLKLGEQDSIVLTVRNDGTAADTVRLTAQTDAPITFDTADEAVQVKPGQSHDFIVRITPLSAGSGTLDLLATGDDGGTVLDSVLVAVEAAPSPDPVAEIAASLDPTAVQSAVGQATAITVRLANEGGAKDVVSVKVSGQGLTAEPSELKVALEPGEAVARQVWITPTQEGASQVVMSITSDQGADLKPIVLMDTVGSLLIIDDHAEQQGVDAGEESSKKSPGVGFVAAGAALAFAMLARRKLRKS